MSGEVLGGPAPHAAQGAGWVARHTRSILAIMLALTIAGGFSAVLLPTGLFPVVQFPRVVVNVDAGGVVQNLPFLGHTGVRRPPAR